MFSLGWMEISIILIITVIVVGPKEIPTVVKFVKNLTSCVNISRAQNINIDQIFNLQIL